MLEKINANDLHRLGAQGIFVPSLRLSTKKCNSESAFKGNCTFISVGKNRGANESEREKERD